jgi:hypothetical protein
MGEPGRRVKVVAGLEVDRIGWDRMRETVENENKRQSACILYPWALINYIPKRKRVQ